MGVDVSPLEDEEDVEELEDVLFVLKVVVDVVPSGAFASTPSSAVTRSVGS
jgi:hypothetical protein